jgi:hypothetical protein
MPPWLSYKNYEIQSVTTLLASGQWQVEVRVFFHDGRQVGNWGGLVPAYYATKEEAFQAGKAYGRQWVDSLWSHPCKSQRHSAWPVSGSRRSHSARSCLYGRT